MPAENIIVIVNDDIIYAYLTSISKCSSVYISLYYSYSNILVFFMSLVHPLSLHLRKIVIEWIKRSAR